MGKANANDIAFMNMSPPEFDELLAGGCPRDGQIFFVDISICYE